MGQNVVPGHTRMGVPYEYTHMGRPIRVWANIRIWGRTVTPFTASGSGSGTSTDGGRLYM